MANFPQDTRVAEPNGHLTEAWRRALNQAFQMLREQQAKITALEKRIKTLEDRGA